ncbi:MAG TPA: response regulator transcription factor [bacterium]|nr:response regulator transcription factor [bacterium]
MLTYDAQDARRGDDPGTRRGQKPRILLVDDERAIVESLRYALEKEGYEVLEAGEGGEALELARRSSPDLVLLDIMLPGMSGFEICRVLRQESTVPILMLTARGDEPDRIVGLDLGADDYITKPFSLREVLARVRAALRRAQTAARETREREELLSVGEVAMDVARHEVTVRGQPIVLPPRQFDLLRAFLANPGRVLTRAALLQHVWGYDFTGDDRTVDVHVRWLRQKLQDAGSPTTIETVRGVGYKLGA